VVIKGDGIGPEVVDLMLNVLKECNMQAEIINCEAGSEQWEKNGSKDKSYIPDVTMDALKESDACFKGPTTTIPKPGAPRSVAVTLRQKFELYSNIRPIKTYERLTPNRNLDFVCFREATEGLYSGMKFKYQMMQLLLYVRLQEIVVEDSFYPHLNGLKNIILKKWL